MKFQRWTVDYKDDLIFIRKIYSELYKKHEIFLMKDVIHLLGKKPNLLEINAKHTRNEGYLISLKNDK